MQKKVTLSLDSKVYADFKKYCRDNDIMLSKRIDRLIKVEISKNGKKR